MKSRFKFLYLVGIQRYMLKACIEIHKLAILPNEFYVVNTDGCGNLYLVPVLID